MPNINTKALIVSFQCLNSHNNELVKEINKMYADEEELNNPGLYDLEEELLYSSQAESNLREAYLIVQQESDDMLPYEELIGEQFCLNNDS